MAPVIWITGIPASGKTTIANLLKDYYQKKNLPVDILDGDELRKTLSSDLGFSEKDRKEHNRRVIFVAKLLSKNGVATIIPLISPYRETREFARKEIPSFIEVWVKASLEECKKRDPKGLQKGTCGRDYKPYWTASSIRRAEKSRIDTGYRKIQSSTVSGNDNQKT